MHGTAFHWRVILDDVALKNVRSTGAADGAGESNILQMHNRDLTNVNCWSDKGICISHMR